MNRDYIALAAQYQADVIAGRIPACRWVRLACERNRRDLDRQETDAFPYRFDPDAARRICAMAEMLPHIKGPKAKLTGEIFLGSDGREYPIWASLELEPWQCWLLSTCFGWLCSGGERDGLRRFTTALTLIPRKNGKSFIGAVVALYGLTMDGESGPECYSAATTRDQAKVVAETAWHMARRSRAFCEHFGVRIGSKTTLTLDVPSTAGKFAPLSSDAHTLEGLNVSLAIIDELHAHKTRAVWEVLINAVGARLQPMIFAITTAGVDIGGICHEKLQYLEKLLTGDAQDESFFGINYTVDESDDWRDTATHRKANPNYGVSVSPDEMLSRVGQCLHSQAAIDEFMTKKLNMWIHAESSWMSAALWQTCHVLGLTWEALKQYPCWIGVDLGEVRDFSAVVLVFKTGADAYAVLPFIYVPADGIARSPIAKMSGWVRQGYIIKTGGSEADYQRIEDDLVGWFDTLNVQEIDFDRRSARLMIQKIKQRLEPKLGRDRVARMVIDVPQSAETFDPAMTITEGLVEGKRLQHDGNEVMAWMIGNVVVDRSRSKDEKYPTKFGGKDSANKIDGPVAMWTALSQARIAKDPGPSFQMLILGSKRS